MRKTRISITATTSPGTSSDPTPVRTSWMAGESANFSWVAKKKGWKNHPCLPLNDVAWCKLHRWTSVVAPHPILVVQVDPTRRSGSFVGKRPPRFGRRILRPVGHTPATNHKITHSGEKPNKCNQCDYASSRAGSLRIHLKTKRSHLWQSRDTRDKGLSYQQLPLFVIFVKEWLMWNRLIKMSLPLNLFSWEQKQTSKTWPDWQFLKDSHYLF